MRLKLVLLTFAAVFAAVFTVAIGSSASAQIVRVGPLGGTSIRLPFVSVDATPFGTRVRAPFTNVNTGIYGLRPGLGYGYPGPVGGVGVVRSGPLVGPGLYGGTSVYSYRSTTVVPYRGFTASPTYDLRPSPYERDLADHLAAQSDLMRRRAYESARPRYGSRAYATDPYDGDAYRADPYGRSRYGQPLASRNPLDRSSVDLRDAASMLFRSLSARPADAEVWMGYLGPDRIVDVVDGLDEENAVAELSGLMTHYEGVAGNPDLASIWSLAGFRETQQSLQQWLDVRRGVVEIPPTARLNPYAGVTAPPPTTSSPSTSPPSTFPPSTPRSSSRPQTPPAASSRPEPFDSPFPGGDDRDAASEFAPPEFGPPAMGGGMMRPPFDPAAPLPPGMRPYVPLPERGGAGGGNRTPDGEFNGELDDDGTPEVLPAPQNDADNTDRNNINRNKLNRGKINPDGGIPMNRPVRSLVRGSI